MRGETEIEDGKMNDCDSEFVLCCEFMGSQES